MFLKATANHSHISCADMQFAILVFNSGLRTEWPLNVRRVRIVCVSICSQQKVCERKRFGVPNTCLYVCVTAHMSLAMQSSGMLKCS